jgi:hypothetical protein
MSTTGTGEKVATTPELFSDKAIRLLKEYGAKLYLLISEATPIDYPKARNSTEERIFQRLQDHFQHLLAPCEELARQTSGVLEQGKLDSLEKVELWLSLSEFENGLTQGRKLFGSAKR